MCVRELLCVAKSFSAFGEKRRIQLAELSLTYNTESNLRITEQIVAHKTAQPYGIRAFKIYFVCINGVHHKHWMMLLLLLKKKNFCQQWEMGAHA